MRGLLEDVRLTAESTTELSEAITRTMEAAEQMGASFDPIPEASHFLQDSHGAQVAELLLKRIGAS